MVSRSMCGLLLVAAIVASRPLARADAVLDEMRADYHEDAPGARAVAAVTVRLVRDGAGALRAHVDFAAHGASVQPVPGFEGVAGVNLRTAEELHRLLADGGLRLVVKAGGGVGGGGEIAAVEHARLATRRVTPAGDVELEALTPAAWPVRVALVSDALPIEAVVAVDVMADDVARLRVTIVADAPRPHIAAVESLGDVLEVHR